jgi:uncharacterized membrane protein
MLGDVATTQAEGRTRHASLIAPGIMLGLGLGGFLDGIVLHQIMQWHNMLSSTDRWPVTTLEGMEANMRGDGLFHVATWVLTVLGLWMLWNALRNDAYGSGRALVGWMLAGWGIFNVVEGIIDHQILGLHNVHEASGNEIVWDILFLAFGAALIIGGRLLAWTDEQRRTALGRAPRSGDQ